MKKIQKNTKKDINIPAMDKNDYMAVYGTLRDKTGLVGKVHGGKLVFPGHTYYPAWVRDSKCKEETIVELKSVSREKMAQLDAYENVGNGLYKRTQVEVYIPQLEERIKAWIYEAGETILKSKERFKPVPYGDWFCPESYKMREQNEMGK